MQTKIVWFNTVWKQSETIWHHYRHVGIQFSLIYNLNCLSAVLFVQVDYSLEDHLTPCTHNNPFGTKNQTFQISLAKKDNVIQVD